ncbi:hypothetical protein BpHYR1_001591 [Brachionus plicatilis]|uniref:Uncharacterized protein n=1 Tax=Brachionus plicatilis TaxID=10195 RepID=A0A3M7T1N6_BRAPC|nr:hypothetical protein BpHYR1_001591 [Brachionus plicatilis]
MFSFSGVLKEEEFRDTRGNESEREKENEGEREEEMNDQVTCGAFQYATSKELATVGPRWEMWLERFKLYVHATNLQDDRIKSTFLLMIGPDVYEIYKSFRSRDDNETHDQAYKLITDHFTTQRSEFAEEQKFRQMKRREGEPASNTLQVWGGARAKRPLPVRGWFEHACISGEKL